MIANNNFYGESSSEEEKIVETKIREPENDKLTFKKRNIKKINKKGNNDSSGKNIFKDIEFESKQKNLFIKKRNFQNISNERKETPKKLSNKNNDKNGSNKYDNRRIENSDKSDFSNYSSDYNKNDSQSDSDYNLKHKNGKGSSDSSDTSRNGNRRKNYEDNNRLNMKKGYTKKNKDIRKKEEREYYRNNNDRILDEIWYTKEDDFVDSFYNVDVENTYHKEKKMQNNFKNILNSQREKVNQKNVDNNLWELNKLKQGGVNSTYNKLQLERINEANNTNEVKKIVLIRQVTPFFIDKMKNSNAKSNTDMRKNDSNIKAIDNLNSHPFDKKNNSTSYFNVVKDETCDFVKSAKKGSEFLKYFKTESEKSKGRDRYWEIERSKLGELLKMHRDKNNKETDSNTDQYDMSMRLDKVDAEDEENRHKEDVFDYKKDKMYSINFDIKNNKKNTLKDKEDLLKLKESLPIYKSKQELLDAVYNNNIIIIVGETGSGKTTQIVQYLYEAGYHKNGIICCTQPRRVAAVSVAYRVSYEMNVEIGSLVGYTIRFEDNTSKQTKIRYVTDGILLRETLNDQDLDKYSVIIMDEAHERSINTDVLLGILKNICLKRNDLKLLVTSATIDSKKFSEFFGNAPIYNIQGRTFKVHLEYLRTPCNDYIECAVQKAIEIHFSDNSYDQNFGDILIFMTGQDDINATCYLLSERFYEVYESYKESNSNKKETINKIKSIINNKKDNNINDDKNTSNNNGQLDLEKYESNKDHDTHDKIDVSSHISPFYIFPIYSQLSSEQQSKIFQKYDLRKIIVSTNIAETSLTLDGIKYVIDTGYCKLKVYNQKIGMDVLQITPISQANANQRSGRAGRTGAGICYRLYTENTFLCDLYPNNIPEIQRSNLSNVVLLLKSLNVENIFDFDFIDAPSKESIINSLHELWVLGAINNEGNLTETGQKMILFPLDPPLSKIIIYSEKFACTKEVLIIVSMLSSPSIFIETKENTETVESKKEKFAVPESDHLTLLNIYLQWRVHDYSYTWCNKNFIQYKSLNKAKEVYSQLSDIIKSLRIKNVSCNNKWDLVRKTICSGYFHNAAKLKSFSEYINLTTNVACHVHPNSSLYNIGYTPDYVIYQEIVFTTKEYMRNVTTVDPEWLCELGPLFFYMKNG
ncbi:pre-mRNA-splicing factor ATP-dependent RNA helicase PRP16, putative [Plasmodium vinckei vinckei]|uniref:RNA helicase n=1 Tax=Plasmodium vinckei vinckei TaxID=54757 RepID=A0A449BVM3_PLAVN|nr:pre-mRNA-splicing factor ATP-dependent RNA helicase PRP16, putative [Plasmodium vinckei vinckei]KEG02478.1 adenosinetriphosphatase [Plasmodium vinckei vinckei]VEV57527.1 pre-mRNA-splicing factor ATP-dependent RNA helicase PRP16, putative [Plasmodium vinckei vinckei]